MPAPLLESAPTAGRLDRSPASICSPIFLPRCTRARVPCLDLGRKTKRYLAREVLAWIQERRVS